MQHLIRLLQKNQPFHLNEKRQQAETLSNFIEFLFAPLYDDSDNGSVWEQKLLKR